MFNWVEEIDALIRQEALTDRLGQVACRWANEGEAREWHWFQMGKPCPGCGAAL